MTMNGERHNTEQKSRAKEPTTTTTMPIVIDRLPIPHRIAGFALTATFVVFVLLGLAHHNFRGEILGAASTSDAAGASPLRSSQSYVAIDPDENLAVTAAAAVGDDDQTSDSDSYYIFLQKFPLESSFKMIFHTEVIVCPRETFSNDPTFSNMLDGLSSTLAPSRFDDNMSAAQDSTKSPFAPISQDQWSKQSVEGCVQLGYGGANCGSGCCGSPHKQGNRKYALNSHQAVISNAMGEYKELYFYGVSGSEGVEGISGEDAYKAVCHGHMNAIEMGGLPKCVSNWAGRDYNPLTNNCNTFTSTVLKCVYGLSDAKPHLGVSDLRTVTCPSETTPEGETAEKCVIPTIEMDQIAKEGDVELSLG